MNTQPTPKLPVAAAPAGAVLVPLPEAVDLFDRLCQVEVISSLLKLPAGYVRCWTPTLTVMAMILGHLSGNPTLSAALRIMRSGVADSLCKSATKISTLLQSCVSTSAFSQARGRLPLTWLRHLLGAQASQLRGLADGVEWFGLAVRVLDGTMITLRPFGRIPKRYPPHSNQHGHTYWCQMRVLACMCLGTGLILSLVTGNAADSEQAQVVRLILFGTANLPCALPASVLWMGDANFGVWRVVAAARQSGQHVLVRLTRVRAAKLAGAAKLADGLDMRVSWAPSRFDRVDRGLKKDAVAGRLIVKRIERKGFRPIELLLFTTLDKEINDIAHLVVLYHHRWQIELSLRHFKTQMGLGELRAKSPVMAMRELITGALGYNLVRGLMLMAAAHGGRSIWALSFSLARDELVGTLLAAIEESASQRQARWERVLYRIGKGHLPRRKKPRPAEPRLKRHRRESFAPLRGDRQTARHQAREAKLIDSSSKC